ncbi:MAG: hypothetical protein HYR88_04475 [Verrucomicrobia bacterium]|nr:hypothetical protein [Verrucomicrobiota bacterium]
MIVWSLAILLTVACGIVGFYVGAIRCAITTVALILTLVFIVPLSLLTASFMPSVGLAHPVTGALVAPLVVLLVFQILAKAISHAVTPMIDNFYKYKATDTQRMLFERMNQRIGPCVGIVNALFYMILVGIGAIGLGYGTVPLSRGTSADSWVFTSANLLAKATEATGWARVAGPYVPVSPLYLDAIDVVAEWFHQPLIQSSLSTYPPLIPLAERKDFETMGNDVTTQGFILKSPSMSEILEHAQLGPLFTDPPKLEQLLKALGNDLTDLKTFLASGQSPKFDDEKILGRWDFNLSASVAENKKARRMSALEANRMMATLATTYQLQEMTMLATIDHKVILRKGSSKTNNLLRREGTWARAEGGKYKVFIPIADDKTVEAASSIEGRRIHLQIGSLIGVFDRW